MIPEGAQPPHTLNADPTRAAEVRARSRRRLRTEGEVDIAVGPDTLHAMVPLKARFGNLISHERSLCLFGFIAGCLPEIRRSDAGAVDAASIDAGDALPDLVSEPVTVDQPTPGADRACPSPEIECQGRCVDLRDDADHCGACGVRCRFANARAACQGGRCVLTACDDGVGDCDGDSQNGCETNLGNHPEHCARCSNACRFANASAVCRGGQCAIGACNEFYLNCDGSAANGCEIDARSDSQNCGACGVRCASACVNSVCR